MRFFLLLLITVLLLPVAGVQAQDAVADLADIMQVTGEFRSISAGSVNDGAVEIFFTPSELAIQNEINNKLDLGRIEEEITHFGASYFASLPESLSNLRQTTQFIPSDYRLGVDDVLLIKMRGMQIQDIEETVTREGTIALPNGKRVFVFGSPLPEAEKRIIAEIADLYKNVTVSVEIKKVREFYVSIVGEVKKPGLYLVNGLCQPMDLLLLSGGPTENGSYRKIEYYQSSTGLTLEPQGDASSVKKTIDLYSFFRGGEQQKEFLQPGDKILVPAIGDYISIYGEIKQPAIYELNDEKTLQDIIHLASSFTPEALQSKIQLKRIDETGFTRIEQLNFNEPADQNFPIENGDVIYIPYNRGFSLNKIYIEGNVWYPGIYNCKPNMKISELLELAGGCLPGSALKLELLRFVSFEKRQIISVPLNEEYFLSPENDFPLENLDILRVFKQSNFIPREIVSAEGFIAKPGNYPLRDKMRILDLIASADGLRHLANNRKAELQRFDANNNIYRIDVDLQALFADENSEENLYLQKDDKLVILSREEMYALDEVEISGEIQKPGTYKIAQNEKIASVILKAGGFTTNAFLGKAELYRVDKDGKVQHELLNLLDAINNPDGPSNIELQNLDRIVVLPNNPLESGWIVSISGEVKSATEFNVVEKTTVLDLIKKAGGLTSEAYLKSAELVRFATNGVATVMDLNLEEILTNPKSKANIELQNMDSVKIFKIPSTASAIKIELSGQVNIPGTYSLERGSKLSDLIQRAGGFRAEGYPSGIVLVRDSLKAMEANLTEMMRTSQEKELLRLEMGVLDGAITQDEKALQLKLIDIRKRFISLLGHYTIPGRYIFDPVADDPILENGDSIVVPPKPTSVMVLGAVYGNGSLVYKEGITIEEYLTRVGGAMKEANMDELYVIKPNGFIERGKSVIVPGDVIVVPPKDIYSMMQLTGAQ